MPAPVDRASDALALVAGLATSVLALAAVLLGAAVWLSTRDLRTALAVLLDLLLAAGLLKLELLQTWTDLLVAAGLVVVRQVIGVGLRRSAPRPGRRPGHAS